MKKRTFSILLYFVLLAKSFAQLPEPCPLGASPQGECETACIHCDFFNGYQGATDGQDPSSVPQYCGSIENDQWFGLIANCAAATFTVTPVSGTCDNGDGIQIALYPECGGSFLQCNVGCSGCGNTPQSITVSGMVPGQNYFLVIDGYAGDQCDFALSVIPPSCVQGPSVGAAQPISGPQKVCPGGLVSYCTPSIANAGAYEWTCNNPTVLLNGEPSLVEIVGQTGSCVTVEFPANMPNGTVSICVKAKNACSEGSQKCKTIVVAKILPTTAPLQTICFEDCVGFVLPDGSTINCDTNITTYDITYETPAFCDSLVKYPVKILPPNVRNLGLISICSGDCFEIEGQQFCDAGNFSVSLTSAMGCDSTVNFSIQLSPPTVAATANFDSIDCQHPFVSLAAVTPFLGKITWRYGSTGEKITNDQTFLVFAPGLFVAILAEGTTCERRDTIQIFGQVAPFSATATGGKLPCSNSNVQILGATTATNPVFIWSGPSGFSSTVQNPMVSAAGIFTLIVGENGCLAADTALVLAAPPPPLVSIMLSQPFLTCAAPCIELTLNSNQPIFGQCVPSCAVCAAGVFTTTYFFGNDCQATISKLVEEVKWLNPTINSTVKNSEIGLSNGSISITQVFGGQFPYAFLWSNGATTSTISGLAASTFSVTITDANGCTASFSFVIDEVVATKNAENETSEIRLAPNPTDGQTHLFLPKSWAEKSVELEVFAADGRHVEHFFFEKMNAEMLVFDLKSQPSGVFWLKIRGDGERVVFKKLVKM